VPPSSQTDGAKKVHAADLISVATLMADRCSEPHAFAAVVDLLHLFLSPPR
jgi:hypothetical protein